MVLMKLFSGQQWRHTQTIDLGMWGRRVGEEGEGGMCGESTVETYVTICEMESQWGLLHDRELQPGLCDDLEGGVGRRT